MYHGKTQSIILNEKFRSQSLSLKSKQRELLHVFPLSNKKTLLLGLSIYKDFES